MRKNFSTVIASTVMSLAMCFSSFAIPLTTEEAAQAVLATNNIFYRSADGIRFNTESGNIKYAVNRTLVNTISSTFRGCSICEAHAVYTLPIGSGTTSVIVYNNQLDILASHQDYVNAWATSVAKALFPSGTDRTNVLKISYLHIARNYPYNDNMTSEEHRDAQGAYFLITRGFGICASLAKTFRSLVEAVPFNPSTGLVDWECESPTYIKAAIVSTSQHEWVEIQDADGVWYVYDLATTDRSFQESLALFHKSEAELIALGDAEAYDNFVDTSWSY